MCRKKESRVKKKQKFYRQDKDCINDNGLLEIFDHPVNEQQVSIRFPGIHGTLYGNGTLSIT